jgi:hypothetical protein
VKPSIVAPEPARPRRCASARPKAALAALAAGFLLGCGSLPVAEVEAPAHLAQAAVQRLPAAHMRSGSFQLDGALAVQGRFTRSADRLSLFEAVDIDRAALTLDLGSGAGAVGYRCTLRRTGAQVSVLALPVRPMQLRCSDGGARQLSLDEALRSTRTERQGRYSDGGVTLAIESLHRLRGSPLPLEQPGGYLLSHQGQPVAVLDLLDRAPRLRAGELPPPVRQAVRDTALLLALLWDPAR